MPEPVAEFVMPPRTEMSPAMPPVEAPVPIVTKPVEALEDVPELMIMTPEGPDVVAPDSSDTLPEEPDVAAPDAMYTTPVFPKEDVPV